MPWSSLVRVFDLGGQWRKASIRLVEGEEATVMVKRVEDLLEDAMKVLKSHERLLPQREYKSFSIKHSRLLLRVVEVKRDVHDMDRRSMLSATPADRQAQQTDVIQLYDKVRTYHTDVLTASRRAQDDADASDDDYDASQSSLPQSSSSNATWYSFIASQPSGSSEQSETSSVDGSDTSTLVEPYVAVAHIPASTEDEPNEDEDIFRQILILEGKRKRMIIFNPNPCSLKDGAEPLNESSLIDMARAGTAYLKAKDPESLEGYRAIGSQQEPSWVESMIQTMSKLGVGVGSDMV